MVKYMSLFRVGKAVFCMKLTVLTDNTTRIDAYYLAEPGVSYYI